MILRLNILIKSHGNTHHDQTRMKAICPPFAIISLIHEYKNAFNRQRSSEMTLKHAFYEKSPTLGIRK